MSTLRAGDRRRAGRERGRVRQLWERGRGGERVSYYDGDPWSNHQFNEIECAECGKEYDEQEGEGNICPACKEKEGENE